MHLKKKINDNLQKTFIITYSWVYSFNTDIVI